MKNITVCLSIAKRDEAFDQMIASLSRYAEVLTVPLEGFSLQDVDIFIGKKLSVKTLESANRLKAAFAYKTGVDDFPIDALRERGILLFNSHADCKIIAEYALGLAISLVTRISEFDRKLRQGIWYDIDNRYWKSIFTMKVGLVGYGHIGRYIHEFLKKNGIGTYTLDRGKEYRDIHLVNSLEKLCEECDILILSLPKTPDTDKLFDRDMLMRLKDKFIVNVGRSNAIDQGALFELLESEYIRGAAIDTWDEKPKNETQRLMPSAYRFEMLDNVILSPHAAMRVENGHSNYVEDVTENVIRYLTGKETANAVDLTKGY